MTDDLAVRARRLAILGWLVATALLPEAARAETIEDRVAVCGSCHGEKGTPVDPAIPVLWGQQEGYIYLQLRDFKKGARPNEIMGPIASALERDDMKDIAAYFAAKPWPALGQAAASDGAAALAKTVNSAIGCTGCHLGEYQGTGSVPRLAGQSQAYLGKTLDAFRSGERANNPGMTSLAKAASEDDLKAIEDYLAGL